MKTIIKANNISKTYGEKDAKFLALKKIDLSIKRGESVAIIGKSGSGKSTLIHILALLDKPTKGNLSIDGNEVSQLSRQQTDKLRNKMFGFVFQQFFLNANDSVLNNVVLPLKVAGVSSRERIRRAKDILREVELEDKIKNKASDLSGGQKQRVVIARALINNPEIIFADEPTGNLDSFTGQVIEDLLFKLNRERGITLIIVTHDKELADRCDRKIYLKDGQITRKSI